MAIGMSKRGRRTATPDETVSVANEPAFASDLRAFVGDFLERTRIPEDVADEILMAVGEVVANACVHGRPRSGAGRVDLTCGLTDAHVVVTVADDGSGFDVDRVMGERAPDVFSQGGRGFFLMRQLMDRVGVDSSPRGTTVTVERDLPS